MKMPRMEVLEAVLLVDSSLVKAQRLQIGSVARLKSAAGGRLMDPKRRHLFEGANESPRIWTMPTKMAA